MNKQPCRITDDPYYDYSDYIEGEGVYSHVDEDDRSDAAYDEYIQDKLDKEALNSTWDPVNLTPDIILAKTINRILGENT